MIYPCQKAQVSFEYRNEIGQEGRNSKVYLAKDSNLDGEIVIKEITKASFDQPESYFDEARKLYKSTHPNVVQVSYACEDDENIYIAMPHYKNGSLKKLLESRNLTVREIIKYATEFLSGLHNIHSKNLIHMDIKPDNILLSDRWEALLSDFGLSQHLNPDGLTEIESAYPKILPPEYFSADRIADRAYDIYQAGLVLYVMCVGLQSFNEQFFSHWHEDKSILARAITSGRFPVRDSHPPHIPKKLIRIINKCLNIQPQSRPKSALEIINVLADIDGNILDWEYFIDITDGSKVWQKQVDNKLLQLRVMTDHSSKATKTTNDKTTRINAYCKDRISVEDILNFLENY
ncbi:serine/threonine-protein kinase [Acinetobacter corruptisaponis]|uniref:Serine/threonine-protein kinase n=1 Tax=Acinetobacter corruptisaponis TaxID=3045147 RepID=A0ABY8S235_9GAMM|nr:serine/threonine-protein kinase [Acinetobacter sp. KCTC 92772]WHP05765.1 serine/threonine-protein kinase [Acinetobacter sp. KCTC 92772]